MKKFFLALTICLNVINLSSQEGTRPLSGNLNYYYQDLQPSKNNISPPTQKKAVSLQIPFKEDFSYSPTQSYPNQTLWSDSSVYINSGYGIAPPSIGVATFDGLNKYGYPYTPNLTNMSMSLPADYLTSQPVNTSTFQPTDSLGIQFYYQARGRGDTPEPSDSLVLDFFKPNQNKWERVWFAKGNANPNTNDTLFKRAIVYILDTAYFSNNFRFRFRNRATTAGDFDHWHLDYIYMHTLNGMIKDTTRQDLTFGYVPGPLLKNYSAMPWKQYVPSEKVVKQNVFIRNNALSTQNSYYKYSVYADATNALLHDYDGGAYNLGPFRPQGWDAHPPHASPSFTFSFPAFTDSIDFRIKHSIATNSVAAVPPVYDFFSDNDTILQYQRFRNYYAFDDGSAEGGYYVLGAGGRMLQQIQVHVADTFRALRIYFDPVGDYNTTKKFRINVYDNANGFPGNLIHVDSAATNIVKHYTLAPRGSSPEYVLQKPVLLNPGTYFIGFQQFIATGITVGIDKNTNHADRLWFDSGNGWTQSSIYGSVMMRPVFGDKVLPPVGITEQTKIKADYFTFYPNPANTSLNIVLKSDEKAAYTMVNSLGQMIINGILESGTNSLSTSEIPEGIYFITLKLNDQPAQCRKIIIRH